MTRCFAIHACSNAHHHIRLAWRVPLPHVAADNSDEVTPVGTRWLCSRERRVVAAPALAADQVPQSYDGVGVLVECKDADGNAATFSSLEWGTSKRLETPKIQGGKKIELRRHKQQQIAQSDIRERGV